MNLCNTRLSLGLVLTLFASLARAGSADIAGPVSYQISGSNVTITADRIENTTTTRTTGTLYLTLRMTSGPDVTGTGYTVARKSLSYVGSDLGRLPPEQSFVGISFSTAFSSPPAGSYYAHLYVSEYPNVDTVLDSVTFSSLETIGGGGGGGGGGDGNDTMGAATPIAANSSTSGAISTVGDVDFYRLTVTSSGTLTASTSSGLDTVGSLYDGAGTEIARNDDGVGTLDFAITQTLTPGTYYLKVEGYGGNATGAYTLSTMFTGTGGGGGGGGGSGNSGVELIGSSNWVTDSSNGTVTLFQGQIRNTRAVATGQLTLMLRAYANQGDDSGYTLASYDIGVLSAGAAISGVSATVAFDDPPSGSYYTAYQLTETTSSGAYLVDQVDFDGVTDFGDSGGGGSVSPPMVLALGALAAWRRKAGRSGARKEVTPN